MGALSIGTGVCIAALICLNFGFFITPCCGHRINGSSYSLAFTSAPMAPSLAMPTSFSRLYSEDEIPDVNDVDIPSYYDDVDSEPSHDNVPRERVDLSVNNVTLCGRIGFISTPFTFDNGVQCLRLAVATSERARSGIVKTEWHKVKLFGANNVAYIAANARVGDRVMCVGSLRYKQLPQDPQYELKYPPKMAEVVISTGNGRHTLIVMPRTTFGYNGNNNSNSNNNDTGRGMHGINEP